ncbi:hypothetical protein EDB84DRAFT_437895 [Lactarius hengduanensis]|nr:hypothetical protein EDB84DRAFT_437895 [Lactarius hengduanensis]
MFSASRFALAAASYFALASASYSALASASRFSASYFALASSASRFALALGSYIALRALHYPKGPQPLTLQIINYSMARYSILDKAQQEAQARVPHFAFCQNLRPVHCLSLSLGRSLSLSRRFTLGHRLCFLHLRSSFLRLCTSLLF